MNWKQGYYDKEIGYDDTGRVVGEIKQSALDPTITAYAVFGEHQVPYIIGEYIDRPSARAAIERVREIELAKGATDAKPA